MARARPIPFAHYHDLNARVTALEQAMGQFAETVFTRSRAVALEDYQARVRKLEADLARPTVRLTRTELVQRQMDLLQVLAAVSFRLGMLEAEVNILLHERAEHQA